MNCRPDSPWLCRLRSAAEWVGVHRGGTAGSYRGVDAVDGMPSRPGHAARSALRSSRTSFVSPSLRMCGCPKMTLPGQSVRRASRQTVFLSFHLLLLLFLSCLASGCSGEPLAHARPPLGLDVDGEEVGVSVETHRAARGLLRLRPTANDSQTGEQISCTLSTTVHRVLQTDCIPCPLSKPGLCPAGTVPITQGTGDRGCMVPPVSSVAMPIEGCSQRCQLIETRYECCAGHWGPMCAECPGGANNPCNGRGVCQGDTQETQCQCSPEFTGVSCELCARDNVYGLNCDQVCDCVHGVCNAGARGDGFCLCDAQYQGPRCDQAKTSCGEPACHSFGICSNPPTTGEAPLCVCSPGYSGDGRDSCTENDPCSVEDVCSQHALCTHLPPGRHSCACQDGYYGDGVECYPINYCQQEYPPCPSPSSKCVFDGPQQYHCVCQEGYENYVFPTGCQLVDACGDDDDDDDSVVCPPHAVCSMSTGGEAECECLEGFAGDGQACHGSIMQVLRELNGDPTGALQGSLDSAISMLELTMGYLLSGDGLYTVFVPTDVAFHQVEYELSDRAFRDVAFARYLMKLHIVPTLIDAYMLNSTGTVYTLAGIMAEVSHKEENPELLRYRLEGSNARARLTHTDIPASNGVIHIIDSVLYEPAPVENNLQGSTTDILSTAGRFSQFYSLLTTVGIQEVIPPLVPCTFLAPTNRAIRQLPEDTLDFLMSPQGQPKLLALLKNHVIVGAMLLVQDLIAATHFKSSHGATANFLIHSNGLMQVNRGANVTFSDISARDGYIHSLDALLVPSDLQPVIPNQCNKQTFVLQKGPCVACNETILRESCPPESSAVRGVTETCLMWQMWQGQTVRGLGCKQICNRTAWEPECCPGFYGQLCMSCPGGFVLPCNRQGQCDSGRRGTGVCTCNPGFAGTACEHCNPGFFGLQCTDRCTCVHGICDEGPHGSGHCRGGCNAGYLGQDCTESIQGCGTELQVCHEHAICDTAGLQIRCVCQAGYIGSGLHCEAINSCHLPERGGCHVEATCTYTGPGLSGCTCNEGWAGDGFECVPINPCDSPDKGGCHSGAVCTYLRPGVSECHCNLGYYGNGTLCEPINPCDLILYGGCHAQADCIHTGPGTSECLCRDGYGGDGWMCYQSLPLEIASIPSLRKFADLIQLSGMERFLALAPSLTVFAPTNAAVTLYESLQGVITPMVAQTIVKMHTINGTLNERGLYRIAFSTNQFIQSLLPAFRFQVHDCAHRLCLNNIPVQLADVPATNGLFFILGEVLGPRTDVGVTEGLRPSGGFPPTHYVSFHDLVNREQPNSIFYSLLQQHNLSDAIDTAPAYTVFFPTNEAVTAFGASKFTLDILRYHIILDRTWAMADVYNRMHLDSALGPNFQLRFLKDSGRLFVNNVMVTTPDLRATQGVVHLMGEVLVPLPNHCDLNRTIPIQSSCGSCVTPPECPAGSSEVVPARQSNCQYRVFVPGVGSVPLDGCRRHCEDSTYIPECCSGFYGPDCAECPGGWSSPCNGHGTCTQGTNGTGLCRCFPNYSGSACELCSPGMYGPMCDQLCNCVHGHCREGPTGDGRCICNEGYTGILCDTRVTQASRCIIQCDINAYCLNQQCICYNGYAGNGTHCSVHDPCNEGMVCSSRATCRRSMTGVAECRCIEGYRGDGINCQEINPCINDDSGCHENAECIHTGPGMSTCVCGLGYEGNGRTRCSPINPCLQDNGGCNIRAYCTHAGPALRNCTCFEGHIGDGLQCTGNMAEELPLSGNYSIFFTLLENYRDIMGVLGSPGPLTLLAPTNQAFYQLTQGQIDQWKSNNQLGRILKNHVVGCTAFLTPHLNNATSMVTLSAQPIQITRSPTGGHLVNQVAHVTSADIVMSNGIVHAIDRLLVPRELDPRPDYLQHLTLPQVASNGTYRIFLDLLSQVNLLRQSQVTASLPLTVFMPTDQAFRSMEPSKLESLRQPANSGKLREYLAYHIVPRRTIKSAQLLSQQGFQGLTLQGSNLTIECQSREGFIINRNSRIIDTERSYRDGVFYGLDMVLEPPSIGGRCDRMTNVTFSTDCHHCERPIDCPPGTIPDGENMQACYISVGWYDFRRGCQRQCVRQEMEPNCCSLHYGPDCRVCPGGKRNPCSWHGVCDDGSTGTGICRCSEGFTGTACELCQSGRYGPNCAECQCSAYGQCDDGLSGTGSCFCDANHSGPTCETELTEIPSCSPRCHDNALCRFGNTCECRPEYYGDGFTCKVINQCSINNGDCNMFASCIQTGTQVTCRCLDNYEGDGFVCQPVDPCMTDNGGCHSNATCRLTGPNSRACSCNPPFQGDGIYCISTGPVPGMDCSIDNGGCDENAICFDGSSDPVGPSRSRSSRPRNPDRRDGMPPTGTPGDPHYPQPRQTGPTPQTSWGVSCRCKEGYVGTGFQCNGNAMDTLAMMTNLSTFHLALVRFAQQYPEGQELVQALRSESSRVTLFIPINSKSLSNTTFTSMLIGSHVVTGHAYSKKQLEQGLILLSWSKIKLITESKDKDEVLVNGVPIRVFDIPITNGVLHIIPTPVNLKYRKKIHDSDKEVSVSKLFASVLITIFVVLLLVVAAVCIFIRLRWRRKAGGRSVISHFSVNGGNHEGSVTFSQRDALEMQTEEDERDMNPNNSTFQGSAAYNSSNVDSDTVGFAKSQE